jgi:uncharacterized protein
VPVAQFSGVESFPRPPAEVFARLTDCGFLAGCLPDARVTESAPDRAAWAMKPKLSFVSGELETVLTRTAVEPGQSARFAVFAKGVGATSTVETALTFAPTADGGTDVQWSGDITAVTGLLKMVPKALIQGTAQKVIADVWAAVRAKV